MKPSRWLLENSLWLVGLGLMLASSGIDGAYMARWMTDLPGIGGAAVLGYILNTVSDLASIVLTYWFGRLIMDRSTVKRRLARGLIGAEVVAVGFSWLFSWRQLRIVLAFEPAGWVAPVAAAFIPLLLAFTGYAQSLLAGRMESERSSSGIQPATSNVHLIANSAPVVTSEPPVNTQLTPSVAIGITEWRSLVSTMNGNSPVDANGVNQWLHEHGYETKPTSTARRWAQEVNQ